MILEDLDVIDIARILISAFGNGNQVLICGNGGSAAEAQHFAGELVCKLTQERKALPALALTANSSIISAIANDYGYEFVFSRQVEAYGKPGDVLVTLTTSGKSANVLKAEETALTQGLTVIRLPNHGATTMAKQEMHLIIIHQVCELIEEAIKEGRL